MEPVPPIDPIQDFGDRLRAVVADLWYPSETDAPLAVILWPLDELDEGGVANQLGCEPGGVQRQPAEAFFQPVVSSGFWRSHQGEHLAQRYQGLQSLLTDTLTDLQLYRVGTVEAALYLLGRHPSGGYIGLHTTVVET